MARRKGKATAPEQAKPVPVAAYCGLDTVCGLNELEIKELEVLERLRAEDLEWLLESLDEPDRRWLGLATTLSDDGRELRCVALSSRTRCLSIGIAPLRTISNATPRASLELLRDTLIDIELEFVGLGLARSGLHICRDLGGLHVVGVDICTLVDEVLGPARAAVSIFPALVERNIVKLWQQPSPQNAALIEWLGLACAYQNQRIASTRSPSICDTRRLHNEAISFFATAIFIGDRLEAMKPTSTKSEYTSVLSRTGGRFEVTNSKFVSKIRKDGAQTIRLTTADGSELYGTARKTEEKQTVIKAAATGKPDVVSVEVLGRSSGTLADARWQTYMRQALEGVLSVNQSNIIVRLLWAGSRYQRQRRIGELVVDSEAVSPAADRLNPSQRKAHDAIISTYTPDSCVLLVHGPPGTGKTSVISAAVNSWLLQNEKGCIYCSAASNV